ncbi:MAG: hypothetical protein ACLUI3_03230 [Christensenellales bacterium]
MLALGLKERLRMRNGRRAPTLWLRHYETHPNLIYAVQRDVAMAKEGLQEVVFVEWSDDYDD